MRLLYAERSPNSSAERFCCFKGCTNAFIRCFLPRRVECAKRQFRATSNGVKRFNVLANLVVAAYSKYAALVSDQKFSSLFCSVMNPGVTTSLQGVAQSVNEHGRHVTIGIPFAVVQRWAEVVPKQLPHAERTGETK
ncbi:hypothetical protein [Roseateles sp.]|uniref:hypothetical protein n=1 Tax=Roseateles sp. TaxID=1971397 RepID=UPI003955DE43